MIISDTNYHTTDSKNYKNHISVGMSKPTLPNITLTAIEKKKKMQKCMFLLLANALLECNEERMDEEQSDGFTSKEIDIDKLLGHFYTIVNTLAVNDGLIDLKDVYPFFLKYVKEMKSDTRY